MTPPGAIGDTATRVLLAVLTQDHPTVRSVGEEVGLSSPNSTHHHLLDLRDAGLIDWEPKTIGTLRPLVAIVALGRPRG